MNNRFLLLVKRNWIASVVAVSVLIICLLLFYFYHPESPYHLKNKYVLKFHEIGTLSVGNRVQVNGLTRGKITSRELTEEAVFVGIEVLAKTQIPENSQFKLVNAGLMGEREVCVLLGDSKSYLKNGDTISGFYDEGTAGLSRKFKIIISDLNTSLDTFQNSIDSLFGTKNRKRLKRITNKKNVLVHEFSNLSDANSGTLRKNLDAISEIFQNIKQEFSKIEDKTETTLQSLNLLEKDIEKILAQVETLKISVNSISEKLNGSVFDSEKFILQCKKLNEDANAFKNDLKKSGLRINVDIF